MDVSRTPSWLDSLPARQEAAEAVQSLVAQDPEFQSFALKDVLKLAKGRQVFLVRFRGEKAVLKRFLPDGEHPPAQIVAALCAELQLQGPRMKEGPFQLNQCLLARPDLGLVVLSHARGRRMTDVLSEAHETKRRRLFMRSGQWLSHYVGQRRRASVFGPRYWLKKRQSTDISMLQLDDRQLLRDLLKALGRWAENIQGCPVEQGAIHGDFAGLNLHVQGGVLTGIDVQGECWQAIARDAARFLVWQQTRDTQIRGTQNYGIDQRDWQAFFSSGVLGAGEQETTVPFFIGDRLFGSLVLSHASPERSERIRHVIQEFLRAGP
ncbi:MAG: phosphotransferase [Pseudomonadota bacterium]